MPTVLDLYKDWNIKEKYKYYKINRIGILDIETTNLVASFGFTLSWVLYVRDVQKNCIIAKVHGLINSKDVNRCRRERTTDYDRRILENFIKAIKKYDIDMLIGHYFHGRKKHDIPFLLTRMLTLRMEGFPKHKQIKYGDTWNMCKNRLRLHSYRLDAIGEALNIKTKKTPISFHLWNLARMGDPKALKYVLKHNDNDVEIDYRIHKAIEEYVPIPSGYV